MYQHGFTGRIYVEFDTLLKKFRENPDLVKIGKKKSGTLHEDLSRVQCCFRLH